ncbi:MAG: FAD-dependent oxidoreductase [Solirubrobacterales bacterium]
MNPLQHLFAPGKIGSMTVQNRIVMPAMNSGLGSIHGEVTPEILAYYRERALSGPGIIVTEIVCVDAPRGRAGFTQLRIDHPQYISGLARLAETIQSGGSRAVIQLHHAGRQTSPMVTEGLAPLAPSAIACRMMRSVPEAASKDDVANVIAKFVGSALMANSAGFDGVELHAAHGYLLSQFLSPYTNKREDEYGGSTENRARIVMEIIHRIKGFAPKLTVGVRFNMTDFLPGGLEPEEGLLIASLLEQAGADYLSVSCGMYESGQTTIEPVNYAEGWRVHLAGMVKNKVKLPVFAGGVIRHPDYAEKILTDGLADYVFVGRNQIADPEWVLKAREGRADQIRPCLSCNTCIGRSLKGLHIACTANPRAGRESWLPEQAEQASTPKTILVAGGGPAGMAAAARLAQRGHQVILAEKEGRLGGMLDAAAAPPDKYRIGELAGFLVRQLEDAGVEVRLNTECTEELARETGAQAVVVATGSVPKQLPLCDQADQTVVQAVDLLRRETESGKRFLVIGGGSTGCETAYRLAQAENQVILVEAEKALARDLENMTRIELITAMKKAGIQLLTGHTVQSCGNGAAVVANSEGETRELTVDSVVLALGFKSNTQWVQALSGGGLPVFEIGDAAVPRGIENCLYEAEILARRL